MALVLSPVDIISRETQCYPTNGYSDDTTYSDNWVWDDVNKSPEVLLSTDNKAAYFHIDPVNESQGTAGVRGTKGFVYGEHYWEIIFLEPLIGNSVMVGVGTQKAQLHTENYQFVNLVGMDNESWGLSYKGTLWHGGKKRRYCEPFFDEHTVIGVRLDLTAGTLSFSKNGQDLGVAFNGLTGSDARRLYPLASSTATLTELALGTRRCTYRSLQDLCCEVIARECRTRDRHDATTLPLPGVMQRHIQKALL